MQFLPRCGRPCGLAGRPGVLAKPGGASDSVHRQSWVMKAVKGVLAVFPHFSRSSGLSRSLSASCSLGALDDEEFFVIEGSGVALTPGVSPRCWATRGMGQ